MAEQLAEPQQVADYLQVPVKTLAQWRYIGTGPRFVRIGRFVRYRWADVEKWLVAQSRSSTRSA